MNKNEKENNKITVINGLFSLRSARNRRGVQASRENQEGKVRSSREICSTILLSYIKKYRAL